MQAVINPQRPAIDFSTFYQTHAQSIRAIVRQFNFRDATADDIVQDIFIKAWRSLDHLDNIGALGAWLKVVARNHCLNELKVIKKQQRILVAVETLPVDVEENASSSCEIFEMSMAQLEEHFTVLRDLIMHHKDPVRGEIARLFYVEQKSIREICLAVDMKQNTVLSHLRRFRLIVTRTMHRYMQSIEG